MNLTYVVMLSVSGWPAERIQSVPYSQRTVVTLRAMKVSSGMKTRYGIEWTAFPASWNKETTRAILFLSMRRTSSTTAVSMEAPMAPARK